MEKIDKLVNYFCTNSDLKLSEGWEEKINKYIKKALEDFKTYKKDHHHKNLDICSFVKIKKVIFEDHTKTRYLKGVIPNFLIYYKFVKNLVCRKNIANKKLEL